MFCSSLRCLTFTFMFPLDGLHLVIVVSSSSSAQGLQNIRNLEKEELVIYASFRILLLGEILSRKQESKERRERKHGSRQENSQEKMELLNRHRLSPVCRSPGSFSRSEKRLVRSMKKSVIVSFVLLFFFFFFDFLQQPVAQRASRGPLASRSSSDGGGGGRSHLFSRIGEIDTAARFVHFKRNDCGLQ